jgi:hypothetical protein
MYSESVTVYNRASSNPPATGHVGGRNPALSAICGVITMTRAALSNGTGRSITWPATGAAKQRNEIATTDNKRRINNPQSLSFLSPAVYHKSRSSGTWDK